MAVAIDRPDPLRRWMLFAGAMGFAYVASLAAAPYPLSFALKAVPALTFAALALARLAGRERIVLAIAFLAAAAGDVFLDLDRARFLPHGLGCFLVTQIGFAWAFARRARFVPARLAIVALLVIADAAFLAFAWPQLGALRIPVIVYVTALLTMASIAVMSVDAPWIARGAVAFVVSDSLIGVNRFIAPFDGSTAIIVAIYDAAMLMIAYGLLAPPGAPALRATRNRP